MRSFNLVDESWIPCVERTGETPRLLSLRQAFANAPRLTSIVDPSPAVTISLYRLLLAVLHRSLAGPRSVSEWSAVWQRNCWELDRIDAYFQRWRVRFDLFDAEYPFYQTPGLDLKAEPPVATQLTHERASDRNRPLLFDHSPDDATLSSAEAARYLVAMQNFAVEGLISLGQGEPIANKFTSAAPLLAGAVTLVRGNSLFQTLMLNWVRYNRDDEVPFPFGGDDKPAWEREGGARPVGRLPDGYVDLLTWQSRRILLVYDGSASVPYGEMRVRRAAIMKGYQFTRGFELWSSETMIAFRKNANAKKGPAWFPIGLNPDRVIWRDSQALFQSIADRWQRPKTLDWLDMLVSRTALDERLIVPLEVYGLIPEHAIIRDWRHETLPLPLNLLEEERVVARQLHERFRQAIALSEAIGQLFEVGWIALPSRERPLPSPMWTLCKALLVRRSEREEGREPRREDCSELARAFGVSPNYWSQLDTPFRRFVRQLPNPTDVVEESGTTRYGIQALRAWAADVRQAARSVFGYLLEGFGNSGRGLQASARADQRFNLLLAALLAPYRSEPIGELRSKKKEESGEHLNRT